MSFSDQRYLMVFHWSLSDSNSLQVFRTFLCVLADLNNVVLWMVSTRSLTFNSSCPFKNLLVTVPIAPITIVIIVAFLFQSFFQFPCKIDVLNLQAIFFQFYSNVNRDSEVHNFPIFFIIIKSGSLDDIRWPFCNLRSQRSLCDILQHRCWVVYIPLVRIVKFKFHAHLTVDYLAYPVMPRLILLLC